MNFKKLKARFPHARRVHGVKGIANAHIAAAKKAMTKFFYVVDADAVIDPEFDFSFEPDQWEQEYVHIWNANNPAIGVTYGYGGVKLFNKEFFKHIKDHVDFTTTLTKDIKIHPQIACETQFNSDPYRAFRGAFRETAKLTSTVRDQSKPILVRAEANDRLKRWLNPNPTICLYSDFVYMGAVEGFELAYSEEDLNFINDHELIIQLLKKRFPNIKEEQDEVTDPAPRRDHPMKPEFFFTTRVASVLYDSYVANRLPMSELRDALSDGQMLSKLWLTEELQKLNLPGKPKIAILGGWIGTLALMFAAHELNASIVSVDTDARANTIAEKLNYDQDFSTQTADMYEIDYSEYDVIINTSSEHIPDIEAWRQKIPEGKVVIVQNNNFEDGAGHVSCVRSSAELKLLMKLKEVLYLGTREFAAYNRFMLIGRT